MPVTKHEKTLTSKDWNYHPDLPLEDHSMFRWPPDWRVIVHWVAKHWLMLSERLMMFVLALAAWWLLYPPLEASKTFAFGWIAQVWLVNMGI